MKATNNMRQILFKDLFQTAMKSLREQLWRGGANGGWGTATRRRVRTLARKQARQALREELGNS